MIQNNSSRDATRDTTIEEIHQTRVRIAEKNGGDLAAIIKAAKQRQQVSGRAVWQRIASKDISQPAT